MNVKHILIKKVKKLSYNFVRYEVNRLKYNSQFREENDMTNNDKKLLVYIPCHSDFDLAVEQAKKIKNEF